MNSKYLTNKTFSKTNLRFRISCMLSQVEPTIRQASKYRNKKGTAFHFSKTHTALVNQAIIERTAK